MRVDKTVKNFHSDNGGYGQARVCKQCEQSGIKNGIDEHVTLFTSNHAEEASLSDITNQMQDKNC